MSKRHPPVRIAILTLVMIILCSTLASAAPGKINAAGVKFRRQASTGSEIIDLLDRGTIMNVVSTLGGWSKVKIGNVNGYVFSRYVTVVKEDPAPSAQVVSPVAVGIPEASTSSAVTVSPAGLGIPSGNGPDTETPADPVPAVAPPAPAATVGVKPAEKLFLVSANLLNIREKASADARKLGSVHQGDAVTIVAKAGTWSKIKASGGTVGFVMSRYLVAKPVAAASTAADIPAADAAEAGSTVSRGGSEGADSRLDELIRVAMSFKGVRYVYGGASRKGTDCSGFVIQVYDSIGISTPRSAISYTGAGVKIARENLEVGNVVLFDTDGGRRTNVSHVGIYLGNDKFIHASSTNHKVVVASLSGYQAKYLGARRFLR